MLIITRRLDEMLYVGTGPDRVAITIRELSRGRVKLLIEGPRRIRIDRAERLPAATPAERICHE